MAKRATTPQQRYRAKLIAAGLCHACGAQPVAKKSRSRCTDCLTQAKQYQRRRHNCHQLLQHAVPLLRTHGEPAAALLVDEILRELSH